MASCTDDFSTDGTLPGRTTITGGLTWAVNAGTWSTASGKALCSNTGSTIVYAYVDVLTALVDAQITFSTVTTNSQALIFRYVDTSNYWAVVNDGTTWKLLLKTGGSTNLDPNTYTAAAVSGDVVRVVANGTTTGAITVYINGTLRITSSANETFQPTATRVGMYVNFNTTPRFDDFSVTDLNASSQDTPELDGRPGGLSGQRQMNQLLAF